MKELNGQVPYFTLSDRLRRSEPLPVKRTIETYKKFRQLKSLLDKTQSMRLHGAWTVFCLLPIYILLKVPCIMAELTKFAFRHDAQF